MILRDYVFLAAGKTLCFGWDKKTLLVFYREGQGFTGIEYR